MIFLSILQAIGLFLATNIDDIIVLSLFFARGAGQRGTTARILVGQYLGFAGILGAAVLVALGAGAFLPPEVIPYFGLIPLALGLWAAWQAWRRRGRLLCCVPRARRGPGVHRQVHRYPTFDRGNPGALGAHPVPDRSDRPRSLHPDQWRGIRALTTRTKQAEPGSTFRSLAFTRSG